jgi:hypothetical protein
MHGLTGGSWKRSHGHRASFLPNSRMECRQVSIATVGKVSIVSHRLILALLEVPTVPGAGTHRGSGG